MGVKQGARGSCFLGAALQPGFRIGLLHVKHEGRIYVSLLRALTVRGLCAAIGFNVETVTYKNIKFQVWDLGGQTSIRPYWRCYYPNTQAIIYVVDSTDVDRIGISRDEFHAILEEEELKDALILVYANKQVRRCWAVRKSNVTPERLHVAYGGVCDAGRNAT